MQVSFHRKAIAEMIEAAKRYDDSMPVRDNRLLNAVDEAVARIRNNPKRLSADAQGRRRCPPRKFKYTLIYRLNEGVCSPLPLPTIDAQWNTCTIVTPSRGFDYSKDGRSFGYQLRSMTLCPILRPAMDLQ